MRVRSWVLTLGLACRSEGQSVDPWSEAGGEPWDGPSSQRPPPADFQLSASNVVEGEPMILSVSGAPPFATVQLGFSDTGVGPGPCPAALAGSCLGIRGRARPLSLVSTADGNGDTSFSLRAPPGSAGRYGAFQAVVIDAPALMSNPIGRLVGPASFVPDESLDQDGDGYSIADGDCADFDASFGPGSPDEYGNWIDRDCDDADGTDGDGDGDSSVVSGGADCDDGDPDVGPGSPERCNGADDDCDGIIPSDESDDSDGDGAVDCADQAAGAALSFDGGDYVVIPGTVGLFTGGVPITVEAWFRTSFAVPSESAVVGQHLCGVSSGFFLGLNSYFGVTSAAQWYYEVDLRLSGSTPMHDGQWHHLAGTWDGATSVLYVDGAQVSSQSRGPFSSSGLEITIGQHSETCGAGGFTGIIDEVTLWAAARSPSEIQADAAGPVDGSHPSVVAQWTFNGVGGQVLPDVSGHGRDGRLGSSPAGDGADPTWVDDGPFGP